MTYYVVVDRYGYEIARYETSYGAKHHIKDVELGSHQLHVKVVEQDDEMTDDSSNNMTYEFIADNGSEEQDDNQDSDSFQSQTYDWGYGEHSTASGDDLDVLGGQIQATMDELDEGVDEEMVAVLEDAQELVGSVSINDFECSHPDCGLSHGHGPNKHDIRNGVNSSGIEGFNITDEFADQMEFVANCHCGANEAGMLVQFFHYFNIPMFSDQEEFEGVLEIDADLVTDIYREVNENGVTVAAAVSRVASRRRVPPREIVPPYLWEHLRAFIERRQHVESGANSAPIGQETQSVIDSHRESIEVAIQ